MDDLFRDTLNLLRDDPAGFEQQNELDINMVDFHGRSLLFYASSDVLELLIRLKINLDIQDNLHKTWLHYRNFKIVNEFYKLIKSGKYDIKFNPNPSINCIHILQTWSVRDCIMDFFVYNHVFSEPLDATLIPNEHRDIYSEYLVFHNLIYEIEIN